MDNTTLYPEEREHLTFLASQDILITEEFCKQVKSFINEDRVISPKMYISAAKKLQVQPSQVRHYFPPKYLMYS